MADGFQLQWTIEGETQLSRKLLGMQNNIKDFRQPFNDSAKLLRNLFSKEVFSTEGGVIGEKWARLSPYTVAQKARLGYPPDILVRTGEMKRSFQTIVSSDQAVIYNTSPYFKYHQSNQPRAKIPRRVMMKLGSTQKEQVVKIFQAFIRKSMATA